MTTKETKEWRRLHRRWATQKATTKEMLRCMDLDRKAEREARERRKAGAP